MFSKEHTKKLARPRREPVVTYIDNPNGFFDNLQLPPRKKHGRALNFAGKTFKLREKVHRLKD